MTPTEVAIRAIKAEGFDEGVAAADCEWRRAAEFSVSGREPVDNPYRAALDTPAQADGDGDGA